MSGADKVRGHLQEAIRDIERGKPDTWALTQALEELELDGGGESLTADQLLRVKALELTVEHFKDARIGASYLTPAHLVDRAATLEAYLRKGKG